MSAPGSWSLPSLIEAVSPVLPGFTAEVLPEVDSTNSELMRRARAGDTRPTLLVAERQTAGRGRRGREWHSAPGDSLTFSLGLPLAPASWSGLSLAVGVAVARALHPDIGLKWPNDLWLQGRKLAGILVETASVVDRPGADPGPDRSPVRYAVVGVGINIAPRPPGEALATPSAALRELWPQAEAAAVLARIASPLAEALRVFDRQGFAPFEDAFRAHDLLQGRTVTLSDGTVGTARGVDGSGALLVHTAAGLQTVSSAEVSVRPSS